jgi:hypothetical protein
MKNSYSNIIGYSHPDIVISPATKPGGPGAAPVKKAS